MASKKTEATEDVTAASAEQDELERTAGEQEQGAEKQGSAATGDTAKSEPSPEAEAEQSGISPEDVTLVYIGSSLPYGKLRSSMILKGTQEEIDLFLAKIREQYPEVTHLLVTPDKLTQALEKVGRKGTILHKYYEDMLAKSRASRKGQG